MFSRSSRSKDGLNYTCKKCISIQRKPYYIKNRKILIEKAIRYQRERKDLYRIRMKNHRSTEKWRKMHRITQAKRRLLKSSTNDGTITKEAIQKMLESQGNKCKICLVYIDKINMHKDHIIPLIKGGKHIISNIQCLCNKCNIEKRSKIYN